MVAIGYKQINGNQIYPQTRSWLLVQPSFANRYFANTKLWENIYLKMYYFFVQTMFM